MSKSFVDVLSSITSALRLYLPLVLTIVGFIGFLGNLITYTRRALRSNTCCIYSLAGSIVDVLNLLFNLFPSYFVVLYNIQLPWTQTTPLCKLNVFLIVFLPHLSANYLLFAIIDRYAATSSLDSRLQQIVQLKRTPIFIGLAVIISSVCSMYSLFVFETFFGVWCVSTDPLATSILYIILIGLTQPILMLLFVLLTYRNIHRSRRRVGNSNGQIPSRTRTKFITMIFGQIFIHAFISIQWIAFYTYSTLATNDPTDENMALISFFSTLSINIYYLNNVKAFYISLLTSNVFRNAFFNSIISPCFDRRFRVNLQEATVSRR